MERENAHPKQFPAFFSRRRCCCSAWRFLFYCADEETKWGYCSNRPFLALSTHLLASSSAMWLAANAAFPRRMTSSSLHPSFMALHASMQNTISVGRCSRMSKSFSMFDFMIIFLPFWGVHSGHIFRWWAFGLGGSLTITGFARIQICPTVGAGGGNRSPCGFSFLPRRGEFSPLYARTHARLRWSAWRSWLFCTL